MRAGTTDAFLYYFCMQNMKLGCVQPLMEIYSNHSLEFVLYLVGKNELSECDQ